MTPAHEGPRAQFGGQQFYVGHLWQSYHWQEACVPTVADGKMQVESGQRRYTQTLLETGLQVNVIIH